MKHAASMKDERCPSITRLCYGLCEEIYTA